ncbi:MAG: PQQ-binding-like beta-propeller repeat protein [Planctomycetes bacterium]|nr:PQQ-binding-like beta-propeller repeat protein [Planctomycetota bacterium]
MRRLACLALLLIIAAGSATNAADWPAFRGPTGSGVAEDETAPTAWSGEEDVRWKASLPQPGNGSPIAVRGCVLVTSAEDAEGRGRSLYCFDAMTGKQRWVRTVTIDKTMPTHKTNPYCGSTPASDGRRVVVWHASAGLHCYDLDGRPMWSRDLGEFRHMWGYGSSPIVHQSRVILHAGPGKRVFLTAIDLDTGETLWETDEPLEGSDRNAAGKYMGSWSTPVIAKVGGRDQIILQLPTRVNAYDPDSGKIIWTCDGNRHDRGDLAYSSPILVGDLCFVTGGFSGVSMAIRLGGTGDVTQTHRLWRKEKVPQNIGSGVTRGGLVYRPNAGPGTIECIDPQTGEVRWEERAGNHWASIVMAGDLLYATSQNAQTIVFRPNADRLDVVATNRLPGSCNATPAIAAGKIYIRTDAALYCIGR